MKYFKAIGALIFSGLLLYVGFAYLLSDEQRKLFYTIPADDLIIAMLLIIPAYMMGGLELRLLYAKFSNIKLSLYDTIALPFVINLWGFIFPFQGSFLYTAVYIYSKYKKNIFVSASVYLFSTSISLSLAGLFGLLISIYSDLSISPLFIALCLILLVNPACLFLTSVLVEQYKTENKWFNLMKDKFGELLIRDKIDRSILALLVGLNIINTSISIAWLFWMAQSLNLAFTLTQVVLITLLMKLLTVIKLTPGNLGLSQIATGGLAVLVGGTMSDGFMLSAFQYLTVILITFTVGSLFFITNTKHFGWSSLKSILIKE